MTHTLIEDFGLGTTKAELSESLRWLKSMDLDDAGVQVAIGVVKSRLELLEKLNHGEVIEGP